MGDFTPRNWTDGSAPALSAANIEDLETRVTDYADTRGSAVVYNVKNDFGAAGDDTTDDTAALQDAIDTAKSTGGVVYLPPGTYRYSDTLDLSSPTWGFRLTGASGGAHVNKTRTCLNYAGTATPAISCAPSWGFEIDHIRFSYLGGTFTGDLISVDGATGSDPTNWRIHHCVTDTHAESEWSARSGIRVSYAIIGQIDHCHLTAADNPIRLGDPGGGYVVSVSITDCTFNFANDAMILIGSLDGENIVIDRCVFEAGTDTTAIRGASGPEGGHALYCPVITNCWYGDSGAPITWIDGLTCVNAFNPGVISGNRFASNSGGTTIAGLDGKWVISNNGFENGSVFGDANGMDNPVIMGNGFNNVSEIWSNPPGNSNYTFIGNYGAEDQGLFPQIDGHQVGIGQADGYGTLDFNSPGALVLGRASSMAPMPSGTNKGALYSVSNDIYLQAQGANKINISGGDPAGTIISASSTGVGFNGVAPQAKPEITGSTGGNAALQDLLASLETMGLITDSST